MATKLAAAQIATQAGCAMIIMDGRSPSPLSRLCQGERHTLFSAATDPKNARAQWIAGSLKPKGKLYVDDGAARALNKGKSLLSAGVTRIKGKFEKGDAVYILDQNGNEIARGLISYSRKHASQIIGLKSGEIESVLGFNNGDALIHRDNLVMQHS